MIGFPLTTPENPFSVKPPSVQPEMSLLRVKLVGEAANEAMPPFPGTVRFSQYASFDALRVTLESVFQKKPSVAATETCMPRLIAAATAIHTLFVIFLALLIPTRTAYAARRRDLPTIVRGAIISYSRFFRKDEIPFTLN